MRRLQLPIPLTELVPHRPPMLWLNELVEYSDDRGRAVGTMQPDHFFADGRGVLHPSASIELIAQAAAAHEGCRRRMSGQAIGGGFLVGVRNFTLRRAPSCGEEVVVAAERRWAVGPMHMTRGSVWASGDLLAEGELTFFLSEDLAPPELRGAAGKEGPGGQGASGGPLPVTSLEALAQALQPSAQDADLATIRFDASFPAFRGHFPGFPVLPAVVAVLTSAELVRLRTRGAVLGNVRRAKFSRAIMPGATVTVECQADETPEASDWQVRLLVDDGVAALILLGIASPQPGL